MSIPEFYLDFWRAHDALRPLLFFVASIVLYGIFVFHFYRFLARKDIFQLDLSKFNEYRHPALRKAFSVFFYLLKSLVMFPIFISFWFIVLAGLLLLMGRGQSIDSILLGAMGVVATIRVCAYYNTALSTDIAKILPFALLGLMLIDSSLVQIPQSTDTFQDVAMRIETITYYLIAVVLLEFLLRIVSSVVGYIWRSFSKTSREAKAAAARADAVDQTPTAARSPATAHSPLHTTSQAVGSGFDQVYGRELHDLPRSTRVSLPESRRVPGRFPNGDGAAGYPERSLIRNSTLRHSPQNIPFPFETDDRHQ